MSIVYEVAEKGRPSRQSRHSSDPLPPLPNNLIAFVPYACNMLQAPFRPRFIRLIQDDYVSKLEDKKRKTTKPAMQSASLQRMSPPPESAEVTTSLDVVVITAVVDTYANVVELVFQGCRPLPRLLLKVIALCLPYQAHLQRVTVRRSALTAAAVHELACLTCLTDICLDDSPVLEANYYMLVEELASLRCLSLDRCRLGDAGAARLAACLPHPLPGSRTLQVLSLASDGVGDRGARALALALRSNRTLVHLNLAGNRLTDEGFAALLDCLRDFSLTADEFLLKRKRRFEYLRERQLVYGRVYAQTWARDAPSFENRVQAGRQRKTGRAATQAAVAACASLSASPSAATRVFEARVEALTAKMVGPFRDPFSDAETVSRAGGACCVGNTVLCYLNVAHNQLGFMSAVRLLAVLEYQQGLCGVRGGGGLVRVVVEGNPLPAACDELSAALLLLERQLLAHRKSYRRERDRIKYKKV